MPNVTGVKARSFSLKKSSVLACVDVPDKKQSDPPPKALQDKSSLDEIVSKRGNDDLVERLYNELVDKTPELRDIENRITIVSENKKDSTELFDKYDEKNQTYYRSADKGIGRLGDSILKLKMRTLITNSLTKYNSSLFRHIAILKSIEKKKTTLEDLHEVLKITWTLPIIEKYQKNNLPSAKPLESFSFKIDEVIQHVDSFIKK